MLSRLPERIDPRRLADQAGTLSGQYALGELPRLAPLLADTAGDAAFRLSFGRDAERRAVIRGEVEAVLRLTCQRCLEPLEQRVRSDFALAVVSGPDEAESLPYAYEALLAEEATVRLRDIVEEELLLSVPAFPRHEGQCASEPRAPGEHEGGAGEAERNPFSALAALRRRPENN